MASRPARRHNSRGFTMVELMVVIAMIGVLAAIATVGYRKYLTGAHSAEAKATISAIRISEESRRAETLLYSDCDVNWYPAVPGDMQTHWHNPTHPNYACWRQLNVANDSPTRFGFVVRAGGAGAAPPALLSPGWTNGPTWPAAPAEPWFTIEAIGDSNGNGRRSRFVSSSFNGEIYVEDEYE